MTLLYLKPQTTNMHFRKHILLYTLLPLLVITTTVSYYHFIVTSEYVVQYEGECDPKTESCFEGCEDDTCESIYPYKIIERQASSILSLCGPDITDCPDANVCTNDEMECRIEYCDQEQLGQEEYCFVIKDESAGAEEEIIDDESPERITL